MFSTADGATDSAATADAVTATQTVSSADESATTVTQGLYTMLFMEGISGNDRERLKSVTRFHVYPFPSDV